MTGPTEGRETCAHFVPVGLPCDECTADQWRADDATKAHKRVGNVLAAMFDADHPMRKDWEAVGMALPRK